MLTMKRRAGICAVALIGTLLLDGCSTMQRRAAADDGTSTAASFPDPSRASLPEGSYVNLENLRKVGPGLTKAQLYALLGAPHFNEGVFGVREWNYIFDFRKADGSGDHFSCQYQIDFDRRHLAASFHWKPASCESVLEPPRHASAPTPVAMPSQPIRLSSDALFAFDRSTLTAQGRRKLSELLAQVRSASQIEDIMIAGYTDRIGSDRYNLALSRRRAEAVRDYLAAHGVPAGAMRTEGRGKSGPLAQCSNRNRAALIACLAPNRRVELSGVAHQP